MKCYSYFNISLLIGLIIDFVPIVQSQPLAPNQEPEKPVPFLELPDIKPPQPQIQKIDKKKAVPETIDLPEEKIGAQGNWIKKKEWLKEALKINEEIQKICGIIQKAKQPFSEKALLIDGELDTFYKQEGFEQGKLQELFTGIDKYLEKKRKQEIERTQTAGEQGVTGELEIKINLIEKEITNSKKDLEQLKLDMQSIGDLDKSIHDRLKRVDEQISLARSETEKAENLTDETWYIIDDKKARNNYYELKGNILEKLKAIQNYLQADLLNDFESVLSSIRTQIEKVKEGIKSSEEKGFIIKNRAQRVEKLKREELETLRAEKALLEKTAKEAAAKKIEQKTWYTKIYDYFVDSIASIYLYIKNLFGGKQTEVPPITSPEKEISKEPVIAPTRQAKQPESSQPIAKKV